MAASIVLGGCLCGAVRYEATGEPYSITHCHCADCRKSSGAPFVTWASFRRNNFRFTHGTPREIAGTGRIRSFCANCGTTLTFLSQPDTDEVDVAVCSLDYPDPILPQDHTWTEDRLPWIQLADDLPRYARTRKKNDLSAMRLGALAIGAQAIGAFAVGALALDALALGAVAIGRLAIGRAKIKRMEIDELVVKKIRITDSLKTPGNDETGSR